MRLEQLTIENFRGFESLSLRFHPEVTVLVGANGSGKTTVLEAVVLVLASALRSSEQDAEEPEPMFSMMDARPSNDPAKVVLALSHRGKHVELDGSYSPASIDAWLARCRGPHAPRRMEERMERTCRVPGALPLVPRT
jgi:chromosome segregation ATPase